MSVDNNELGKKRSKQLEKLEKLEKLESARHEEGGMFSEKLTVPDFWQ